MSVQMVWVQLSMQFTVKGIECTNHVPNQIGGEKCRLFDLISRETFKHRSTHEHTKMRDGR